MRPSHRIANLLVLLRWLLFTAAVLSLFALAARADDLRISEVALTANSNYTSPLLSVSVRMRGTNRTGYTLGSGTVVQSKPCLILTAMHLVDGSSYTAEWTDGARYPVQFLFGDREADIAVFHCPQGAGRPDVQIATTPPSQSAPTWTIGASHGEPLTEHRGRVLSVNRHIESSAVAIEGRSGGGVFGKDGTLIGVITARDPSNGNATIATGCQSILDLFGRNRGRCPGGVCPIPPQQPQQPGANPGEAPPPKPTQPDDTIAKKIAQLEKRIADLEAQGPVVGPAGPAGANGNDGKQGKDADNAVITAALWEKILANREKFQGPEGKPGTATTSPGPPGPPGVITIRVIRDDGSVIKEIKDATSGGVVTVRASKLFSDRQEK